MDAEIASSRVGRVRAHRRGRVWYLTYFEQRRRRQPRVGPERDAAKRAAAEINAQIECGAPAALGFKGVSIPELRQRWLDHHEHKRRSSLNTIRRFESATRHLLNFLNDVRPLRRVGGFRPQHVEEFVRYLRSLKVPPNGHARTRKRPETTRRQLETALADHRGTVVAMSWLNRNRSNSDLRSESSEGIGFFSRRGKFRRLSESPFSFGLDARSDWGGSGI